MKTNPRCDHQEGNRRCPDSAGYRVMQGYGALRAGRFCLRHARSGAASHERVMPLSRLRPEDR